VEEGIVPREKVDDWVIIASVFIHPQATDFRKIYHYNYGATKLALRRALAKYPTLEKMLYDNALLARVYIEAYQVTKKPLYRQVATEVLDYVLRLRHPGVIPRTGDDPGPWAGRCLP
jgi:bifunctional enzyme Fae/Hps